MQRSTERFLTTHTGSLPRPDGSRAHDVRQGGGRAGRRGRARRSASPKRSPRSCASRRRPVVDIVNDGEMSKPSYATYIKDRLAGFGGEGNTFVYQDSRTSRTSPSACSATPGARGARRRRATRRSPCAIRRPPQADVDHLEAAIPRTSTPKEMFLTAASPGVVSLFFRNEHYPSDEAYLFAIADAMRHEYEAIAQAPASCCRSTAPTSRMGRHIQYANLIARRVPPARRSCTSRR